MTKYKIKFTNPAGGEHWSFLGGFPSIDAACEYGREVQKEKVDAGLSFRVYTSSDDPDKDGHECAFTYHEKIA
ncbi:MAG: hypothetical protein ISN29_00005 [Gammaproteobacteria bacterium AqS3]|nr:hypothetical protein [Gammaproteobacteria bacterium AqS3]